MIRESGWERLCFQFLGIPPKGEHGGWYISEVGVLEFPISRDPPEGGTILAALRRQLKEYGVKVSNF